MIINKSILGSGQGTRTALGAILFITLNPAWAGEFVYGVGYMFTRSDNITNAPSTGVERSETFNSYLLGASYNENTIDLVAQVLAQVEFRDYRKQVFDDESILNLRSSLVWNISPQKFTWTMQDTYEETRINTTLADTPNNRARINVFTTGPDAYLRFNPVHTLALGARAGNVDVNNTTNTANSINTDNNRFSGTARWLYHSSAATIYSLNYEHLTVDFDDSVTNTNYVNRSLYLSVDYRPSRSQYVLDLGATRIVPDRGETLDETLARFSWIRNLTNESRLGVSASGEYSDTGTDLLEASTSTTPIATQTGGVVTSDVYYTKRGSIFYTHSGTQFALDLSAFAQDLDFRLTAQDRKEHGGRIKLDFIYSPTTTVSLIGEQIRSDYQDFVREDTDSNVSLRFSYRLTRTVSLALEGRNSRRDSTIITNEYEENRALFTIQYSSHPSLNLTAR